MLSGQFITLKDHRKLAFNVYGDPDGKPVFYFHGWPASRLSGTESDSAAKKLHLRIISPDRPGYGLSDFQPHRTLLNWAYDVSELADQLKLKKFAVIGVSGGGPYAAACAYALPNRITHSAIVVGLSPVTSPEVFIGMVPIYAWGWQHYHHYPITRTLGAVFQLVRYKYFPFIYRRSYASTKQAFCQGIRGPEWDLKLYTDDWGFNLEDIKTKVDLWYAPNDKSAPLAMGKYYAAHIPNSVLHIFPSGGHLSRLDHEEEILGSLITTC